jgi:peptidoglycan/xylan/chitin deacetylase (PgdA/CDA1 family)
MSRSRILYLMYHGLELRDCQSCLPAAAETHYVLPAETFCEQVAQMRAYGFDGISVGEALKRQANDTPVVAITFDDGCESDLTAAAPALEEVGFRATFYLVAGVLGQIGYLSPRQARQLAERGFEIGCHSMSHRFLTDLNSVELRLEMVEAKQELEDILGSPVVHFSCPGGRWNSRVAEAAKEAGYKSVATSRIGMNTTSSDRFRLARMAVHRGTNSIDLLRSCQGSGLFPLQARQSVLSLAKSAFGNSIYQRIRNLFMSSAESVR